MIHAILAAAFCVPCLLLSLPWLVLFWLALLYAGREHAHAGCRYIEIKGGSCMRRENALLKNCIAGLEERLAMFELKIS